MGELVSLCKYREKKKKEEQAEILEEIKELREHLDALCQYVGEPTTEPLIVGVDEQTRPETFSDLTIRT